MTRIIMSKIFGGLQATLEWIENQLNPNLPFSPTLKSQITPVETHLFRTHTNESRKKHSP
ncbi:MAG: hypothetical protein WBV45_11930 [Lutimonas sp.]